MIISGNMGPNAVKIFSPYGIEIATGATGPIGEAIAAFLHGEIKGRRPHGHHH